MGLEKGKQAEDRIFTLVNQPGVLPGWVKEVRQANTEEDLYQGIDLVLYTELGKIYLQVKSSESGRRKFLSKRRSSRILVIVVQIHDTDHYLKQKFLSLLEGERTHLLNLRRRFD